MDVEPISIALKFGFLGVLYLFLFWIASSSRRDLTAVRDLPGSGGMMTAGAGSAAARDAWLVVMQASGITPGTRYDLFGGLTLGRSDAADICFTDRYASGLHARVYSRGNRYFVEDLGSTNGTVVNGVPVEVEQELTDGSLIEIGDTEFRIEFG